jgi:hypothetical protein
MPCYRLKNKKMLQISVQIQPNLDKSKTSFYGWREYLNAIKVVRSGHLSSGCVCSIKLKLTINEFEK